MAKDVRLGKSAWGGLSDWARSLRPDPSSSIGVIGGHELIQDSSDEGPKRVLKWKQD
jgi:hypothetical protein